MLGSFLGRFLPLETGSGLKLMPIRDCTLFFDGDGVIKVVAGTEENLHSCLGAHLSD